MQQVKERFIRVFPGRLRAEIYGLKENHQMAEHLTVQLLQLPGVKQVQPCTVTERIVVLYDPQQVSLEAICERIQQIELVFSFHEEADSVSSNNNEEAEFVPSNCQADPPSESWEEVAVATEETKKSPQIVSAPRQIPVSALRQIPDDFSQIPVKSWKDRSKVPWGLGVTLGGLAFLGAKQLIYGKSALSNHSLLFGMSGLLSVITGYPFLRRGLDQFNRERKWNAEIILGASAIGLGLMRENLIALAGLSILQYIHWKRSQLEPNEPASTQLEEQYLSPSIRKYSEKMAKWAFPLAGATWAITRNPLCGFAVLLAANPRPAIVPTIAAWKKAEWDAIKEGGWVPSNGTLSQLARTKTILVEDTSQLFQASSENLQLLKDELDENSIWNITASLLAKTEHPWKKTIISKAMQTKRTMRTAFNLKEEPGGVQGEIKQITYYFGNLAYMQKHKLNIDPYLLKLKRMAKNGTEAYCLVRKTGTDSQCLGVVFKENFPPASVFLSIRNSLQQTGRNLAVLNNRLQMDPHLLESYNIQTDWLKMNEAQQMERIRQLQLDGEELLLVTQEQTGLSFLSKTLPWISQNQLKQLPQMAEVSDQVDQQVQQQFRITKLFNLAGTVMAIPFRVSAMFINLLSDALSLLFLSRLRENNRDRDTERKGFLPQALREIAATSTQTAEAPQIETFQAEAPYWHSLLPNEVMAHFCVEDQHGLSGHQVQAMQHQFGFNQLEEPQSESWFKSYLNQFKEFTTLLLLGTTLLSFFTGDIFNGLAMCAVLMANAAIGTIQERKAEKVVEALNQYHAPQCTVIREGAEHVIDGKELVPGDIVRLEAGDRVPADLRLIQSWNLEVDESMLTGESVPVYKTVDPVPAHSPVTERINMVFQGTHVSRGRAIGIVVSTGMRTEMGHLLDLLKGKDKEVTPLQQEVTAISKTFVKGALVVASLIFGMGLLRGNSLLQMVPTSIALAASAIPEGLPITVTIALSAGIFRMAKKGALIRKLSALETLGRVTVICTDKTGTLTKNEMTVREVATLGNKWTVTGEGYEPNGELISEQPMSEHHEADLKQLVKIASLCNNTSLSQNDGKWTVKGDPTEGALLALAAKSGYPSVDWNQWNRVHEIPFDSAAGKMSVVCKDPEPNELQKECYVFTKGSIENVLQLCQFAQIDGNVVPLTEAHKQQILKQNEKWANQSLRVLGFAYRPVHWDGNGDGIENDSIFVGMVGMMDPPKAGIKHCIQDAHQLGTRVVMITGDHPATAHAIAKEIGIHDDPEILTGQELDRLTDEELLSRIEKVSVFARVTPEHKLRIVHAYQRLGHKVAMTGDGVNDSPAIKQADVGIAMGQTGTEVTKTTADMVLERDNFCSIIEGVKEGRTIVSNIRKALGCLLTGNLSEILVTGVAVLAGMPIPLIPIQILVMNLLTDAIPAMVLAMNPGNKAKMTRHTSLADRDLYSKVVVRGTLLGLGSLGLFAASLATGASIPAAQTIAFATLVCGQMIQTLSWRREGSSEQVKDLTKDRFMMGAIGVSALALLSVIYVPAFATMFQTVPLSIGHWLKILLVAGSVTTLSKPVHWLIAREKTKTASEPPQILQVA